MTTPPEKGGQNWNDYIDDLRKRIRIIEHKLTKIRKQVKLENHQLEEFIEIGTQLRLARDELYELEKIGRAAKKKRTGGDNG